MAIYRFSTTVIGRSQGRSAVASAAYRAGEKLYDNRQDQIHDYTNKKDIIYKEILLPQDTANWMGEREKLWNAIELGEKRKDAQLAREVTITLPHELSNEQNITLAKEFVEKQFVARGMIADLCFHNHKNKDSEMQPHVHVMLTMRKITKDGFGFKERAWNEKQLLQLWREEWANVANKHLALAGIDQQLDHRSNEEKGIKLEPQYKIGPAVAKERLARMADHQRIARENGNAIFLDPKIALDTITRQQSTFTEKDLAKFINRHTENINQFKQVFAKVKACDSIVRLGFDKNHKERFTTKEMFELEKTMLDLSKDLNENQGHQCICDTAIKLSQQQELAFYHLINKGDLKCVVGFAGTGKSYLLNASRVAWEDRGFTVKGAALSGIAAENLETGSGISARTIASYIYHWDKGKELLTKNDVLVIDEAGMIGSRQMARVINEVQKAKAKIVLVGDPEQLQAIEAGAAFRAIANYCGYVELNEIRRQKAAWQKAATRELALGQTTEAIERFDKNSHLHHFANKFDAADALVKLWHEVSLQRPKESQIILAYTRKEVEQLNNEARGRRKFLGELGKSSTLLTVYGNKEFAVNDKIYFLKNDKDLCVKNGTLGIIKEIKDEQLTVQLKNKEINVNIAAYNNITHGYAATIHKAQGITVDRSYFMANPLMHRHLAYTGLTRHKLSCDIFYDQKNFKNKEDLIKVLNKEQTKDLSIDYSEDFRRERQIDKYPNEPTKEELKKLTMAEKVNIFSEEIKEIEEKLKIPLEAYDAHMTLNKIFKNCANNPETMGNIKIYNTNLAQKIEDFMSKTISNSKNLNREQGIDR